MKLSRAILKRVSVSRQKAALVLSQIRGLPVERAVELLSFSNKKVAKIVKEVLNSAISNAEHNGGADIDMLRVHAAYADKGPVLKRMRARAKGRGARILKPSAHITVILVDEAA